MIQLALEPLQAARDSCRPRVGCSEVSEATLRLDICGKGSSLPTVVYGPSPPSEAQPSPHSWQSKDHHFRVGLVASMEGLRVAVGLHPRLCHSGPGFVSLGVSDSGSEERDGAYIRRGREREICEVQADSVGRRYCGFRALLVLRPRQIFRRSRCRG